MARRPNYGFVKREKELKKQQKKAEKLARRQAARESPEGAEQQETETQEEDE